MGLITADHSLYGPQPSPSVSLAGGQRVPGWRSTLLYAAMRSWYGRPGSRPKTSAVVPAVPSVKVTGADWTSRLRYWMRQLVIGAPSVYAVPAGTAAMKSRGGPNKAARLAFVALNFVGGCGARGAASHGMTFIGAENGP